MFAVVPTQPSCWETALNTDLRSAYERAAWRRRGWLVNEYKQALVVRIVGLAGACPAVKQTFTGSARPLRGSPISGENQ